MRENSSLVDHNGTPTFCRKMQNISEQWISAQTGTAFHWIPSTRGFFLTRFCLACFWLSHTFKYPQSLTMGAYRVSMACQSHANIIDLSNAEGHCKRRYKVQKNLVSCMPRFSSFELSWDVSDDESRLTTSINLTGFWDN